ncbi:MAG: hypothetical protein KR126chlam2_00662 [Chlamydiae bacterium]|nr:hypothetical protein [Chlamydiota bacterium]
MTTPVSSGLIKIPAAADNSPPTEEGASAPKPKLPPFLEYGTSVRIDLFRKLFEAEIVNETGEFQGKYATGKFPEFTADEIAILKDKCLAPLIQGVSIGELLTTFCSKQTTRAVNLIGSYGFYFLFFELPDYRNRLFADFPSDIREKLCKLEPLALPTDIDIAVELEDKHGGSYFDRPALRRARDLFLEPVSDAEVEKDDTIDRGFTQYQTLAFSGIDIEFSLRGQIAVPFLFSFTNLFIPLIQDVGEPVRPVNYHELESEPRPQSRQGIIDGMLGILRGEGDHYLRYVSYITKGWTAGKRVTLDSFRSTKTPSKLVDEIKQFLVNHHSRDPLEAFAFLFNFCHFLDGNGVKERELWLEFYRDHPKPEEGWTKNVISLVVEKKVPFSLVAATLHHGFLLCHAFPDQSKIHVDLEQVAFEPALKVTVGGSALQLPYSPASTLPCDGELLELLEQVIPRSDVGKMAPSCQKLFEMEGKPPQIDLFSSLAAKTPAERLIHLLRKVKPRDEQIELAVFLTRHLIKEITTPPTGKELATISQGFVFLVGQTEKPALAEELMRIGRERGLIKRREFTWRWTSILSSQLKTSTPEVIFQHWQELKASGEIEPHRTNRKSVELLLELAERMSTNEELALELCALKTLPESEEKAEEYLVATLISLGSGSEEVTQQMLLASMSEPCRRRASAEVVQCHLANNQLVEASKAFVEMKECGPPELIPQFVSALASLESPTLQEFSAVERVIQSDPSGQAAPLLVDFFIASLALPQNDRWKLDVSLIQRLLEKAGNHPLPPSLLNWVITMTSEMSLPLSPYGSLKSEMQRAIPSLLKNLPVDSAQLFLLFEAMNLAALFPVWSSEIEASWLRSQETALEREGFSLGRIEGLMAFPTQCNATVSCEKLWVKLGKKWLKEENAEKVEACTQKVTTPAQIEFILQAHDYFLRKECWESAVKVLEQIFSIDETTFESVWPKFGEPLSKFENNKLRANCLMSSGLVKRAEAKAHPAIKATAHRLLRSRSSIERVYALKLLLHFIYLFKNGEASLWMRVLRQLTVDRLDKFWPTLRRVNQFLSEDAERHKQAWNLALDMASKHSKTFVFDMILEEGLFPFSDEKSMWDRVCETALKVASKTYSPRSREALAAMVAVPTTSPANKLAAAIELLKRHPSPEAIRQGVAQISSILDKRLYRLIIPRLPELLKLLFSLTPPQTSLIIQLSRVAHAIKLRNLDYPPILNFLCQQMDREGLDRDDTLFLLRLTGFVLEVGGTFPRNLCNSMMTLFYGTFKKTPSLSLDSEVREAFAAIVRLDKFKSVITIKQVALLHAKLLGSFLENNKLHFESQKYVLDLIRDSFFILKDSRKEVPRVVELASQLLIHWLLDESIELDLALEKVNEFHYSLSNLASTIPHRDGQAHLYLEWACIFVKKCCEVRKVGPRTTGMLAMTEELLNALMQRYKSNGTALLPLLEAFSRQWILLSGHRAPVGLTPLVESALDLELLHNTTLQGGSFFHFYYVTECDELRELATPDKHTSHIQAYVENLLTGGEKPFFVDAARFLIAHDGQMVDHAKNGREEQYLDPFAYFISQCKTSPQLAEVEEHLRQFFLFSWNSRQPQGVPLPEQHLKQEVFRMLFDANCEVLFPADLTEIGKNDEKYAPLVGRCLFSVLINVQSGWFDNNPMALLEMAERLIPYASQLAAKSPENCDPKLDVDLLLTHIAKKFIQTKEFGEVYAKGRELSERWWRTVISLSQIK